jgi:hypothetical protein
MRLAKLISMLSTRSLHFCRVDRLEDKREAMLSPKTVDQQAAAFVEAALRGNIRFDPARGALYGLLTAGSSDMIERASMFVNCWHRSPSESVAMWKVYSGHGIAVQTTVRRMVDSLPETVMLGQVVYVDYNSDAMNPNLPHLFKDQIYRYENEIRAYFRQPPRECSIISINQDHPRVIPKQVNLNRLIKKVYVAPDTGQWFREVVEEVLSKYGYGTKDVVPSIADHIPGYRQTYEKEKQGLIDMAYPLEPYLSDDENAAGVDESSIAG